MAVTLLAFCLPGWTQEASGLKKTPGAGDCGTYPGRLRQEYIRHQFIQGLKEVRRISGSRDEALIITEDRDDGHIAIVEDDGSIVAEPNPVDLSGRIIRFDPASPSGYNVSVKSGGIDSDMGSALSINDDDTRKVPFNAGFTFPFFGVTYSDLYVNSNGNLTFGRGDSQGGIDAGIFGQDLSDFLKGAPRIAALFADLNPVSSGGVYVKTLADRTVVTWSRVYLYGSNAVNTLQIALYAGGAVELAYGEIGGPYQAVVGISPGGGAVLSAVDFTKAPFTGMGGAIAERFNTQTEVDVLALAKKFYRSHPDEFGFLSLLTNFRFNLGSSLAYELNVSNSIRGLGDIMNDGPGQDIFDDSGLFGSAGKLESFMVLGPIGNYPDDPNQVFSGTNSAVSMIGQQAGHRWGAYVRARINGQRGDALLGRSMAHWSFFHDTNASDLEGNKIRENPDGTFTTIEATRRYSQLDQYLMGLRSASEVASFFYVDSPTGTSHRPSDPPVVGALLGGTKKQVSLQDIIVEEGAREPAAGLAPKIFRMAFVLLVRKGSQPTAAEVDKAKAMRAAWETHFAQATDYLGFMDTRLTRTERPAVAYLPILEGDSQRFTAIAIANRAAFPANVKFTAYGNDGQLLKAAGMLNPSTLALGPGRQSALLDAQLFQFGFAEQRQGWVRIDSSTDQAAVFFLVGNSGQTYLDGGIALSQTSNRLIFSRTLEGAAALFNQPTNTTISLINPGALSASLQFTLYKADGSVAARADRTLAVNGRLRQGLRELFGESIQPVNGGYLEVQSSQPVAGFELVQMPQSLFGLPAQIPGTSRKLYSAQFASGGAAVFPAPYFTDLNLVNTSAQGMNVQVRVVDENGALVQPPGSRNPLGVTIAPHAALSGRADQLFGFPKDSTDGPARIGSIIVEASADGLLGDVSFGDALNGGTLAALPLQSTLIADALFAQVADGPSGDPPVNYFTGIAVLNPNADAAQITVDVYRETGELAGTKSLTLAPGGRFSQTVGQLVPSAAGQQRGYVRVRSTGGSVAMVELFGDSNLTRFLAAVPPQVLPVP